jgi:hypothetical protein
MARGASGKRRAGHLQVGWIEKITAGEDRLDRGDDKKIMALVHPAGCRIRIPQSATHFNGDIP